MNKFVVKLLLFAGACLLLPQEATARAEKTNLRSIHDSVFYLDDCIELPAAINQGILACKGTELKPAADFITAHHELFFQVTVFIEQRNKDSLQLKKRNALAQQVYDSLVKQGVPFYRVAWNVKKTNDLPRLQKVLLIVKRVARGMQDSVYNPGDAVPFYGIWDLSGPRMRPEMKDSLETLLKFIQKHTEITIEVASYTDDRGSESFNIKLSQRRADVIRDYLLSRGVYPPRIIAKGYGEKDPLFPPAMIRTMPTKMEQERLHQANRRMELNILTNAGRH